MRLLAQIALVLGLVVAGFALVVYLILRRFAHSGFDEYGRPLWRSDGDDDERRGQ